MPKINDAWQVSPLSSQASSSYLDSCLSVCWRWRLYFRENGKSSVCKSEVQLDSLLSHSLLTLETACRISMSVFSFVSWALEGPLPEAMLSFQYSRGLGSRARLPSSTWAQEQL